MWLLLPTCLQEQPPAPMGTGGFQHGKHLDHGPHASSCIIMRPSVMGSIMSIGGKRFFLALLRLSYSCADCTDKEVLEKHPPQNPEDTFFGLRRVQPVAETRCLNSLLSMLPEESLSILAHSSCPEVKPMPVSLGKWRPLFFFGEGRLLIFICNKLEDIYLVQPLKKCQYCGLKQPSGILRPLS